MIYFFILKASKETWNKFSDFAIVKLTFTDLFEFLSYFYEQTIHVRVIYV